MCHIGTLELSKSFGMIHIVKFDRGAIPLRLREAYLTHAWNRVKIRTHFNETNKG